MDKLRKISTEEYEQLFAFIKKHYVEYYDLQCELADHLANAIEEQWQNNPNLSFDDALQQEFKKFGIFGFMGVVESRQAALSKRYNKLLWVYLREFFKLPKILLTLLFGFTVFKILEYSKFTFMALLLCLMIFSIAKIIVLQRHYSKKVKATGKRWMLEDIIKKGGTPLSLYLCYVFLPSDYPQEPTFLAMLYASAAFTVSFLYQYIAFFVIPSKAKQHLLKTYPEYNM
jgi:hypothetical protein